MGVHRKLSQSDMNMLRALAMGDQDAYEDALRAGANRNLLVSNDLLLKIRESEIIRSRAAYFEAWLILKEICDKMGMRPPKFICKEINQG